MSKKSDLAQQVLRIAQLATGSQHRVHNCTIVQHNSRYDQTHAHGCPPPHATQILRWTELCSWAGRPVKLQMRCMGQPAPAGTRWCATWPTVAGGCYHPAHMLFNTRLHLACSKGGDKKHILNIVRLKPVQAMPDCNACTMTTSSN
jgi:hypothetical protein